MVRDIGWGFFYGWIFFDDVFGTQNHYGTVDIFAGTYSKGHRDTKVDFLETFNTADVREAFETISVNWINEGYDPLRAPMETGSPLGAKTREAKGPLIRGFEPARRMMGLPGDVRPRSDASGHPINRAFADVTTTSRSSSPSRASRARSMHSTFTTISREPISPGTRRSRRSLVHASAA